MFTNLKSLICNSKLTLYLFLLPAIMMVMVFAIYPLLYNFSLSVHEVTSSTLLSEDRPFVGLNNYKEVILEPDFIEILRNTLVFSIFSVLFQFLFGLAFALFFHQEFPLHKPLRGLLLIGWVIPPAVIGTIWRWLFNCDIGVINYFLNMIGIGSVGWLVTQTFAMSSVLVANIWF